MKWFETSGEQSDIVLSTRVRLARNFDGYPFEGRMNAKQHTEIIERAHEALSKSALSTELSFSKTSELSDMEAMALVERHLISPEFYRDRARGGLLYSEDTGISIMLNEEDHVRLQVFGSGLCLSECQERAARIDKVLSEQIEYAFSPELGYLTRCPTNLGTGMRVSVMLHLPMLTKMKAIGAVAAAASKVGVTVRGMYGEGSRARGELYQISNQLTLGHTEEEIVSRLNEAISQVIAREKHLRETALEREESAFLNRIYKSAGILKYAYSLSVPEAEALLSELRLGLSMGLLSGVSFDRLNSVTFGILPAGMAEKGERADIAARDHARAQYIQKELEALKRER